MTTEEIDYFRQYGHIYYCPYCAAVFMYPNHQSAGDIMRINCPSCVRYFYYITKTAAVGIITITPYTGKII